MTPKRDKVVGGDKDLEVFTPEEHGVLDYNTLPKAEMADEYDFSKGTRGKYFDLRSKALTPEALEILLGETVTGVDGQELDATQPEKTVEWDEETKKESLAEIDRGILESFDLDMVNPPAPMQESVLRPLLVGMIEQDIYKRTAEEQQQRFRDIADAGFTPAHVNSHPKLHHLGKPTPGDPFVEGMLQHVHDLPLPPALKPEEGDYAELVNEEDEQGQVRICRKDGTVTMLMSRASYDAVMNYSELKPGKKEP